jgi:hypothetical protein
MALIVYCFLWRKKAQAVAKRVAETLRGKVWRKPGNLWVKEMVFRRDYAFPWERRENIVCKKKTFLCKWRNFKGPRIERVFLTWYNTSLRLR